MIFWTGFVMFLLSLFKVRQKILHHLPLSIKSAAVAGIGLFLICAAGKNLDLFPVATIPHAIVLFWLVLFFILYRFRKPGAFLISIFASWFLSLSLGQVSPPRQIVALPPSLSSTFLQLDLWTALHLEWLGPLLSVILVCLFDTSASVAALSKLCGRMEPNGRIRGIDQIVIPDGLGSMLASLLGTGTLAFTLESASGIKTGGRTKITAITAAVCTLICLFLYPLIASIPIYATAPAMIAIGIFMLQEAKAIQWKDKAESIPACLTLAAIPLTFSIYYGFALGFVSYAVLMALLGRWKEVHPICWSLAALFSLHFIWTAVKF